MIFRSTIQIPKAKQTITHQQSVLCMGSCFAAHLSIRLQQSGFNALYPFGALYNPVSIEQNCQRLIKGEAVSADELFYQNERWHHFDFHSDYSHPDIDIALQQMNDAIQQGHQQWLQSKVLILTLGTAWCYEHVGTGKVVGNCHRVATQQFKRKRLSLAQIVASLAHICQQAADKQIIITVSPIRHWKDGAIANQRSKALLLLACEQLEQQFSNVTYFPSYEIMMDELRDYRFYADDMMHPSTTAVQYICERFSAAFFDATTQQACTEWNKIEQMRQHKPFHTQSEAYQQLQQKITDSIRKWNAQYKHHE